MYVELIRVKIETFINQTKQRKEIWSNLTRYADDMQNQMTKRILALNKMRKTVKTQFSALTGNSNTEW